MLRLKKLYVLSKSHDQTYDLLGAILWSSIEVNTGIICACLPTLKPIVNLISPSFLQSSTRQRSREKSHPLTPSLTTGGKVCRRTTDGTEESEITLCDEESGVERPRQDSIGGKAAGAHTLHDEV